MKMDLAAITEAFARKGPVILLESQSSDHPWSKKSYIAARPRAEITAFGTKIRIISREGTQAFQANPWEALKVFRKQYGGWLFGYLGYDLKNQIECLQSKNPDPVGAPDLYFMVPDFIVEQDRGASQSTLIHGSWPPEGISEGATFSSDEFDVRVFRPRQSMSDYLSRIKKAQKAIFEGEFYEINLSHQLRGEFTGSPFALYQKMKKNGPVPFGAYLQTPDFAVCSQSPERFLRKEGNLIFTQPIKGTAQRGRSEQEDQALKAALSHSAKERAENLMIVDLVRNDLNRVAQKGSVSVPRLFDIETFSTVHQMVSTVEARTRESDPVRILKSCFPMGSMTGAPKIRVMKAIDTLEKYRRGIYSGAIGYIKPWGDFDFNVVIRTAIIKEQNLFYSVGGAITGDSNPRKEWKETMIKAQALRNVLSRSEQQ
ncbi:aminodeoxychorismate synthase component I [Fodinibius sediminis]|uniref:aminodeoxychorismate synthase n=1 Tax=Fodinibius sediminis TaxID=1214077 RepID=A0A521DB53_9BACT|nr:aminodeoxychorismate synthase component I [Fodinibius sediminis]SMO68832.1 para-aminobenzoate synthetase component 1 [Fodinibius sediminis]